MSDSSERELAIFSAARQVPPGRVSAYLDEACAGDETLRRQVEELLQSASQAADFMETPASNLLGSQLQRGPSAVPAEKPGDRIGLYDLVEQIGEGGCGVVYLARQEQPVKRTVALKIIKLGMDTKSVIARFDAERQALAMMDHPNIARVLDAGATDTGRPYFVMELVRGVKITECCDQNRLSTRERLKLFIQVCQAIQHAHQKGIIHRDIKPSNILVTMQDGVPVPKVIDFGIAKATHGRLTDQTYFTALEHFIGTPAYMSPEQAGAGSLDIDTRSDIYSLGVLLYELLTGRTPFDARAMLHAGLDEVRRTVRETEPDRPSTRLSTLDGDALAAVARQRKTDGPQLIHLVRGDLDWIVMKALDKDRARRYETANGLALDIGRHLDNEPVAARAPSTLYRFQKFARRHRLAFASAVVIGLALAAGVAISFWSYVKEYEARLEADRERLQAEANEKKAQTEAAKSRAVAHFLEDMLNGVEPSVAMGSDTTLLKKILDNTARKIGPDLAGQPEVEAELRYTLGEVYWEIGDLEDAEFMHRRALELRLKTLGPKAPEAAQSMRRLAHVLWRRGNLDEAQSLAGMGIALQRELYGNGSLEVARSLEDYAAILNTKNQAVAADGALREAVKIKEAVLGDNNLEVADSLDDLSAWDFSRRMKRDEAESLARKAIAIRQQLLGPDNLVVTVSTLKLQATLADIQGRRADEEATLRDLIAAQRRLYGNAHPSLAQSLNTLASVLKNEGKVEESEAPRREALAMQTHLLGGESAEVAQTLCNLGELLMEEDKLEEAEYLFRSSLAVRRKILGDGAEVTSISFNDLGQLLEKEGKLDEARELYLANAGGTSVSAGVMQYRLGMLYVNGRGVPEDATQGVEWLRKSAALKHTDAAIALGVLYFEGKHVPKDEAEAVRWFQQAADQGSVLSLRTLADCYCAAGRSREGIATLRQLCNSHPKESEAWLTLATWQLWYGKEAAYQNTCERFLNHELADSYGAEAASKAYCLRPSTNLDLLAQVLDLARHGVELRERTPTMGWFQLSLGMAQFRNGDLAGAEKTLAAAAQNAGKEPDLLETANYFRAMDMFQQGRTNEASQVFGQTESQMPAEPADRRRPLIAGKLAPHDTIITWLAYEEARAMLSGPGATTAVNAGGNTDSIRPENRN